MEVLGTSVEASHPSASSFLHHSTSPPLHSSVLPMIELTTPVSEAAVRALKVGDEVAITGTLFTGRDAVHKYLHEGGQLPPASASRTACSTIAAR